MRCPACDADDCRVVDSRAAEAGGSIRRRRQCVACAHRFTTFERVEEQPLTIVKRSGERVPFDAANIVAGVRSAAKGRPIDDAQTQQLAAAVEDDARALGGDVTSERVGRLVLGHLRRLDVVTALRFASVYKGFTEAADFERELRLIKKDHTGSSS